MKGTNERMKTKKRNLLLTNPRLMPTRKKKEKDLKK